MKVFHPWAFQGSLNRQNYFEGWYFKHVSANKEDVWSFIPGISLSSEGRHAFIQVLNGRTGKSNVFEYGVEEFSASRKALTVHLGKSHFSTDGVSLKMQNESSKIDGKISWMGSFFIGFISFLSLEGRFINLSTWSKARIEKLEYKDNRLKIRIINKSYLLEVEAIYSQAGPLKAPLQGSMTRIIKETVDATIELKLSNRFGKILFHEKGTRAGMELIKKILEYF